MGEKEKALEVLTMMFYGFSRNFIAIKLHQSPLSSTLKGQGLDNVFLFSLICLQNFTKESDRSLDITIEGNAGVVSWRGLFRHKTCKWLWNVNRQTLLQFYFALIILEVSELLKWELENCARNLKFEF